MIIEIDIKEDLLTIDNLSQSYIFENELVILNKEYQYLKLEDYTGDKLYLIVDLKHLKTYKKHFLTIYKVLKESFD